MQFGCGADPGTHFAIEVVGNCLGTNSASFGQHHEQAVMTVPIVDVRHPVRRPNSVSDGRPELPESGGNDLVANVGWEVESAVDHRHDLLVSDSPSTLGVDRRKCSTNVAETGCVVDFVVEFELVDRGLQLFGGPTTDSSENQVADDARRQHSKQRADPHHRDRIPTHGDVAGGSEGTRDEPGLPSEEEERDEHRREGDGGSDLDRVDLSEHHRQHNQPDQKKSDQQGDVASTSQAHCSW